MLTEISLYPTTPANQARKTQMKSGIKQPVC
jgi:hypothetical protein